MSLGAKDLRCSLNFQKQVVSTNWTHSGPPGTRGTMKKFQVSLLRFISGSLSKLRSCLGSLV